MNAAVVATHSQHRLPPLPPAGLVHVQGVGLHQGMLEFFVGLGQRLAEPLPASLLGADGDAQVEKVIQQVAHQAARLPVVRREQTDEGGEPGTLAAGGFSIGQPSYRRLATPWTTPPVQPVVDEQQNQRGQFVLLMGHWRSGLVLLSQTVAAVFALVRVVMPNLVRLLHRTQRPCPAPVTQLAAGLAP